jgi:hypothetical protein
MPANNCLRLNEHQCLPPSTPEPPQNQPEQSFQKEQAAASDAGVSKRPAVASEPSFAKVGCDENKEIEWTGRTKASANTAWMGYTKEGIVEIPSDEVWETRSSQTFFTVS